MTSAPPSMKTSMPIARTDSAGVRRVGKVGYIHQQRREPLNPSKQGHMVDLNATLGEQFLEVPIGQSVTQVPAHSDQNGLRREPEPANTGLGGWMVRIGRRCFTPTASSIDGLGMDQRCPIEDAVNATVPS
jgi:hypothetical protein